MHRQPSPERVCANKLTPAYSRGKQRFARRALALFVRSSAQATWAVQASSAAAASSSGQSRCTDAGSVRFMGCGVWKLSSLCG